MRLIIRHLRVENITQSLRTQKYITHHSHTLSVFIHTPNLTKTSYRRQYRLYFIQLLHYPQMRSRRHTTDTPKQFLVFMNKCNYSFSIVFSDILRLICRRLTFYSYIIKINLRLFLLFLRTKSPIL